MKKIWVDSDPGIDDTFALAMLFEASDKVEVIGISTIFGNVDVDLTTRNARILCEAAGKDDLPVARGASFPLAVPLDTSPFVHGENGMGNMPLPEPKMKENTLPAPQAIVETILSHPNEITLLPIGPLTNIAMALSLEPSIADLVKEVVIMGGAVRCPGNITPAAEANFYHDPHAAQIVMHADWPIYLAALDVCAHGMIPQALLDKIYSADKSLTPFIAGSVPFFQKFLEMYDIYDRVDFPDVLAVGYILEPNIYTVEEVPLFIETEGSCIGQSLEVPGGKWYQNLEDEREFPADRTISHANVMFKVDEQRFLGLVEDLLA
ncbi:MAG: nucleoside hydrolase [Chloroflexota bacterium]|nr:nucleoside hydrolase [Chloroflexota bacterium]